MCSVTDGMFAESRSTAIVNCRATTTVRLISSFLYPRRRVAESDAFLVLLKLSIDLGLSPFQRRIAQMESISKCESSWATTKFWHSATAHITVIYWEDTWRKSFAYQFNPSWCVSSQHIRPCVAIIFNYTFCMYVRRHSLLE